MKKEANSAHKTIVKVLFLEVTICTLSIAEMLYVRTSHCATQIIQKMYTQNQDLTKLIIVSVSLRTI